MSAHLERRIRVSQGVIRGSLTLSRTPGALLPKYTHRFDQYSRDVPRLCALDFLPHDTWRQLLDQLTAGTPYLDEVVLGSADHHPRVVSVEGEVADTVSVATVHEEHLWWAILGILRRLLLPSAADVPENRTTVVGRRAKNGVLTGVPVDLCDGICVALK